MSKEVDIFFGDIQKIKEKSMPASDIAIILKDLCTILHIENCEKNIQEDMFNLYFFALEGQINGHVRNELTKKLLCEYKFLPKPCEIIAAAKEITQSIFQAYDDLLRRYKTAIYRAEEYAPKNNLKITTDTQKRTAKNFLHKV